MECDITDRPRTVGSVPKYMYSDFVMELLSEIEREATCPASKPKPPPKNFFKENFKRLKEIQTKTKLKNVEKQPLQPIKVPNKYMQVQSKVAAMTSNSKERYHVKSSVTNGLPRTAGPYRTQPPHSPCLSSKSENHRALQPYRSLPQLNHIGEREQKSACSNNEVTNKENEGSSEKSLHSLACSKNKLKTESKPELKHRLGRIPTYLTERKKQWELEREKQLKLLEEANIPPGHTLLPDEERLETLELLKKNQEELIQSLAALPVRNDTIRLRNYKEDLERQLAKVEEGIKIFSRPKVLIKNDT